MLSYWVRVRMGWIFSALFCNIVIALTSSRPPRRNLNWSTYNFWIRVSRAESTAWISDTEQVHTTGCFCACRESATYYTHRHTQYRYNCIKRAVYIAQKRFSFFYFIFFIPFFCFFFYMIVFGCISWISLLKETDTVLVSIPCICTDQPWH